jgi:hypothetical protein
MDWIRISLANRGHLEQKAWLSLETRAAVRSMCLKVRGRAAATPDELAVDETLR